jgi:hypothetical protein
LRSKDCQQQLAPAWKETNEHYLKLNEATSDIVPAASNRSDEASHTVADMLKSHISAETSPPHPTAHAQMALWLFVCHLSGLLFPGIWCVNSNEAAITFPMKYLVVNLVASGWRQYPLIRPSTAHSVGYARLHYIPK